jgi:DNA-binding CsgD family transcriptional regulator
MEAALKEAEPVIRDHPDIAAESWGSNWAIASLIDEDRDRAMKELETAREIGRGTTAPGPRWGLYALLTTLLNRAGETVSDELRASPALIQPINRLLLAYADAIRFGRQGKREEAERLMAVGDVILSPSSWYRHYGRRLVAEAAIEDGWGDSAAWLAEAIAFFEMHGYQASASACRSLLRKAGLAPRAISHRQTGLRTDLQMAGVSEREAEVLFLVAQGLSNREIGERLYISPRTAERHVFSLMNKLGLRTRAQLAAALVAGQH